MYTARLTAAFVDELGGLPAAVQEYLLRIIDDLDGTWPGDIRILTADPHFFRLCVDGYHLLFEVTPDDELVFYVLCRAM